MRLILPRRAAYRMAAGLLVPLVLLDAVLNALGHPVAGLLGGQGAIIFWFLAAGCSRSGPASWPTTCTPPNPAGGHDCS